MLKIEKNITVLNVLVTSLLAAAAFLSLAVWMNIQPERTVGLRRASERASRDPAGTGPVDIKGVFSAFSGNPSSLSGSWSGFRGDYRDNISRESVPLTGSLDENDLPVLWSVPLGEGYAGAAVGNGMVYVLDYDTVNKRDLLRAFSLEDGSEVWSRGYEIPLKRNHGYSRTVPAVTDRHIVTIGPRGHVLCADALTGEFRWGIDLEREYGTETPPWYTGQCPLIDNGTAVIAPAGDALLIGIDLESGEVLWETPNPEGFRMSHSSVIPMTFHGKKMYVYSAIGGMTGVSAEGPDTGAVLWTTREWTQAVISPSPVQIPGERLFVTAGYGAGSAVFGVLKNGEEFGVEKLYRLDRSVIAAEQHTPIFYDGSLYSVLPYDAAEYNRQLVRVTPEGERIWASGRGNRFGLGPFIIADGKIFVLDNDGTLTIAEAGTGQYRQLGRARVLKGRESWAPIAVADGRMLLRDLETLICLDMREESR